MAAGLSNREIATRLFLSERTVEGHLEQLFNRLGFHSRAQVAAWVAAGAPAPAAEPLPRRHLPRTLWLVASVAAVLLVAGVIAIRLSSGGPSAAPQEVRTIASGGGAPLAVVADQAGGLYFIRGNEVFVGAASGGVKAFAGSGVVGFSGDGGPAVLAQLDGPRSLAIDPAGDVFIADAGNHRVREVGVDGTIRTVAGDGNSGLGGDGGPAIEAELAAPVGLAEGLGGTLYVADFDANRVRAIRPDGTITTVAGTGDSGYEGDGAQATSAILDGPTALAVDPEGALYIEDGLNDRVRRVDLTGVITTVAGTGSAGFSGDGGFATNAELDFATGTLTRPGNGIAVDEQGDLFIADTLNNRIRVVDLQTQLIRSLTGLGLNLPLGVGLGYDGSLYVADSSNHRILLLPTAGG